MGGEGEEGEVGEEEWKEGSQWYRKGQLSSLKGRVHGSWSAFFEVFIQVVIEGSVGVCVINEYLLEGFNVLVKKVPVR